MDAADGRGQTGFTVGVDEGTWRFVTPDGEPFFALGLNHIDDTNLKYPQTIDVWRSRYGSRPAWIEKSVVPDLKAWGFNAIGVTTEWTYGDHGADLDWDAVINTGNSHEQWPREHFDAAGMPYCVALRTSEFEAWNRDAVYPDVWSEEWDERCAWQARLWAEQHAGSKHLLGYFLTDIPAWYPHPNGRYFPGIEPGDDEGLRAVADRYYETITRHIRAQDPDHLILGDRYNGNVGVPPVVLEAMQPYVDVLSVEYFPDPTPEGRRRMRDDLGAWHEACGKPVLIADIANWCPTRHNPHRASAIPDQASRAADYVAMFEEVADEPWLIGWLWCSYIENFSRGWGLKDPEDEAYLDFVEPVAQFNRKFLNGFG